MITVPRCSSESKKIYGHPRVKRQEEKELSTPELEKKGSTYRIELSKDRESCWESEGERTDDAMGPGKTLRRRVRKLGRQVRSITKFRKGQREGIRHGGSSTMNYKGGSRNRTLKDPG